MKELQGLEEFYRELLKFFQKLSVTEENFLQAMLNNKIEDIHNGISLKQAEQMEITNMENLRLKAMEKAGVEGKTAKEIVALWDGEKKIEMENLFAELDKAMEHMLFLRKKSLSIAEHNLNISKMNLSLSTETDSGIYTKETGNKVTMNQTVLNRDI